MTGKQFQLYIYIRNNILHHGKKPSFSEMCEYMKTSSKQTIYDWLTILEQEGYILRDKGTLRGIYLTEHGYDESFILQTPKSIKNEIPSYQINMGTTVYNSSNLYNKGINIKIERFIPKLIGGENNGSS